MTRRWLPLLLTMAVCGSSWATDHPQDALKLILKQNTTTGKAKAVWVSKAPPPVLPAQPPTSVGGAFVVTGADEQVSALLPAGNWQTNTSNTLYKFVNKLAPSAPSAVKVSVLKGSTVLKVVAKDSVIQLNDTTQGTVAVALTIGTDTYCSVCTSAVKDVPGKFIAKACSAPVDCSAAAPTTTSSTTSSTTTTTTIANCFVDQGLTVLDTCTGLQWEKKDGDDGSPDPGNLHDVDNRYSWAGLCPLGASLCQPNAAASAACVALSDGGTTGCGICVGATCDVDPIGYGAQTTVWDWLSQFNAANFAGHDDWRLPSENGWNTGMPAPREFESILLAPYPCSTSPCIDSIFGATLSDGYSTSTGSTVYPTGVFFVDFFNGIVQGGDKTVPYAVRAVRGGSPSGAFLH